MILDNDKKRLIYNKISELREEVNFLEPYAEGEYQYDKSNFSDEDEAPENKYLVSKEYDITNLYNIIDDIENNINEIEFLLTNNNISKEDMNKIDNFLDINVYYEPNKEECTSVDFY